MYYFISYTPFYVLNTQFHYQTQRSISDFTIVAKDGLFSFSIVTSPQFICDVKRMVLALCHHIHQLFLHVQIGAKVIFTSK